MRDSRVWEEAYAMYGKYAVNSPKKRKKRRQKKDYFSFTHEDSKLRARVTEINHTIGALKDERIEIKRTLAKRTQLRLHGKITNVSLYALRLENDCWYIGQTYNVDKRFTAHQKGKGANWTKLHKPIEIVEVRPTEFLVQDDAATLEDDMTLEYALKYGSDKVRGGGYCQMKPNWPDVIKQNELVY